MPTLKWLKNGNNYYYFKDAPVHISSITLNESSISLTSAGQTEQLTATITPDDAVEKHIFWHSSDITIATVSQTGLVTCVTPGECVITASCDLVSATCNVTKQSYIDLLVVGGGASVFGNTYNSGGGGAGGFIELRQPAICGKYNVVVGMGGCVCYGTCNGCNSCFGNIVAYGGGGACGTNWNYTVNGSNGGSGGGGTGSYNGCTGIGGSGCQGQGNNGGNGGLSSGGGGGGAGGAGANGTSNCGGDGGLGKCSCISGSCQRYAGGGGGYGGCGAGCGCSGGGNGGGGDATTYGSGGGGGICNGSQGGHGCQGVVILRYKTGATNATGGCKYTCGDYTIHCFTSNGTFCIIS